MKSSIQIWRERKGLSREQLAELVGCSRPQITKLERGERKLSEDWMRRIAAALDITVTQLIDPEGLATDPSFELPDDDNDAALLLVEYALTHAERPLSPAEKLQFVRKMKKLVSDIRGSKP